MEQENIRIIFRSEEFNEFFESLPQKVRDKFEYVFLVVQRVYNISTKFIKHLDNTELYEMRVSVGTNEYRSVLLAIDHTNVIEAKRIILLNGFLKKSSKDYKKQIEVAHKILEKLKS
ncbi:type II toxin-antitoxin system RelE/ParE family toxin [Odoribacter lunatus]|uniref:type II toxin-antitoxin system RelE/ParE family toxin n=1 Tax=Odoribacter lunatus TaxID=2941335 RepID=UPI002040B57D|nr:type II toxin-antitoxin system RelE/ParE family toxin [Odoribacter lunatus]